MGREEHCKQISQACVVSARSVGTSLGLPQLMVVCAFQVYTAQAPGCSAGALSKAGLHSVHFPGQAPVALQANCPKWALHFVHFPGLTCSGSGSGSWVLHKGTDSVGCILCPSRVSSSGDHVLGDCRWTVLLDHLPGPSCLVSQVYCKSTDLGVLCVSSGELISGCDPPGRCQPYRIPERFG